MGTMLPASTRQWTLTPKDGLEGLKLREKVPVPTLFPNECLVKVAAVSLNYRDVAIPAGKYPGYCKDRLVPCSDAAGTIIAVGDKVILHEVGDRVCTLFNQAHHSGVFTKAMGRSMLGSALDGPLREYAIYDEKGLVPAPRSLSTIEAATIPCAAVTAWNSLFGLAGRAVKEGDWVLTQGTGGVSLFAIAFAQAVGANVIGTTSSNEKAETLKKTGVKHVINYRIDSGWGSTAKQLTGGDGVHLVVDVGGESTVRQSLVAVRPEGVVALIGFLGGSAKPQDAVGFAECFDALATMRSVEVGSREQFIEVNRFIDDKGIKPVVDARLFAFEEVREAYEHVLEQNFFGKVVIRVGHEGD